MAELSQRGGLAVAVPGEVRGLGEMVRRWGEAAVPPLRRAGAEAGGARLPGLVAAGGESRGAAIEPAARSDAIHRSCSRAKPLRAGDTWRRPDLAWTLGKLRAGPDAFYKGEIAKEIVTAVRAAGGVMTAEDLARYATVDRTPLETSYRGLRVVSMPPSSSGGVALIETLGHPGGALSVGRRRRRARRAAARRSFTCWPRRSSTRSPIARATWATPTSCRSTSAHLTSPALSRRAGAPDQAGRGAAARRVRDAGAAARAAQGRAGRRTCR